MKTEEITSVMSREALEFEKACGLIPNGVQTESKRPDRHVDGVYPKYLKRGKGAYVWDHAGNSYIDYPCGLGSVILGYSDPIVNDKIMKQLKHGTLFSLPHKAEAKLAEKLCELIPSCEMVRFLKKSNLNVKKIALVHGEEDQTMAFADHLISEGYSVFVPKVGESLRIRP